MPRRMNSVSKNSDENSMKITSSDISGPFYSISDVLLDDNHTTSSANHSTNRPNTAPITTTTTGMGNSETDLSNPRAARRNVNEAEVIVTAGGASLPIQRKSRMLPPKDPQEEKKHLQEYETMMKKAKKIEARKKKEMDRKKEEKDKKLSHAIYIWENEIIPNWKKSLKERRTVTLWDQGIPPRCRKKVWKLRIGNQLNITKATFSESIHRLPLHSNYTKKTNDYYQLHGEPMPIIVNEPTIYDHNESSLYSLRRQRRTSSLDVLREAEGVTSTVDTTDDEVSEKKTNITSHPQSSSSTYSFTTVTNTSETSSQHEEQHQHQHQQQQQSTGTILDTDEDTNYTSSDEEEDPDLVLSEDEHQKMLLNNDPTMINFLNKAIDEDILRTLPSLCVFQV
ncbi:uncharacterized protein BX663DRAFT_432112 [Cokeromyces recurvatus]|uniref:uncharacterized protein n=1 Tax=Cokeromyces recurvatus TaxID=90255 RepID=UPI002220D528|nr:uncharacterized protein BX663DRAFT_432112 [Cokeromyces recurvatus]KAI7904348.1 hypothetical protein BX663DRAFT_432112 [Cokeromyces recurvatus]